MKLLKKIKKLLLFSIFVLFSTGEVLIFEICYTYLIFDQYNRHLSSIYFALSKAHRVKYRNDIFYLFNYKPATTGQYSPDHKIMIH